MRIIAGQYRGRRLRTPAGQDTRPTSDRLRETLFNILAPRLAEVRFLDLCAGTGAVGIEALSRGAAHATFVERSRKICGLIEVNLDTLGVPEEETEVVCREAADYLRRCLTQESVAAWDIVYFDPPYRYDYGPVLELFGNSRLLTESSGLLVAEHHTKKGLPEATGALRRWRWLKQGEASLSFYERQ